jgi:hypothetical protein
MFGDRAAVPESFPNSLSKFVHPSKFFSTTVVFCHPLPISLLEGKFGRNVQEDGMQKQLWKTLGLLAALLATSTAFGQSSQSATIADIPFAFTVANLTFPAGRYTLTRLGETTLRISSRHNQGTVVLTHAAEGKAPDSKGKMVFHRYGESYFLAEVWVAADAAGRTVFPSRAEEELVGKRTETQIAVLQSAP